MGEHNPFGPGGALYDAWPLAGTIADTEPWVEANASSNEELQKLLNDKTLTEAEFKQKLAELKAKQGATSGGNQVNSWKVPLWAWLLAILAAAVGAWLVFSPRRAAAT